MTYATLMVHLELGTTNTRLLQITGELARRFKASVIGIAARQPLQMVYGDGYVSGDFYEQDEMSMAKELQAAEAEFRAALHHSAPTIEWRSARTYANLADYLVAEARSADLIVTGVAHGDLFDSSRSVNTADLIMLAGRPVLTVPSGIPSAVPSALPAGATESSALNLNRVLVAWKDTREARRAVADALPLLRQAEAVSVVEITDETELAAAHQRVTDVAHWLKRHHIDAHGTAHVSVGNDAMALHALSQDAGADVIVAGAYGHSRLREWVLGGVTRDLLLSANRCSFVSH
jgi:nucleotide-binding universal stress UspA family protein